MVSIRATVALGAAILLGVQAPAGAQQTYPQSFYWGSGLIDIPVAYVSPLTGDFAINYSGKVFENDPGEPKINYDNQINSQLTFALALFGRVEVGYAAFSSNPEFGFFARGLVINQEDFRGRPGFGAWVPSIALGLRNIGQYEHIDRFGVGYQLLPGTPNQVHQPDSAHQNFNTTNTLYGVVTKDFSLADIRPNWPNVNLGVTVGFGNGLFSEDGGHGDAYASHSTGGLFFGVKSDFVAGRNLVLSLMAENNAWDYNIGGSMTWRGLRAGLYYTEIGAPGALEEDPNRSSAQFIGNYPKLGFTVGWQSNLFALLKGDFLQDHAAVLEQRRQALLAEIERRQQRIAELTLEINRYEAQALLELEQRRAQAEAELAAEREALRRLEERLERLEQQRPPR